MSVAAATSPGGIGDMVSVYVIVANAGGSDTVVSATSEAGAAVTLHDTADADDGSFMVDLERLKVPARGTLTRTITCTTRSDRWASERRSRPPRRRHPG